MFAHSKAMLSVFCLLSSLALANVASAQEHPEILTVDGEDFAAYRKDGLVVLLPALLSASLRRDPMVGEPSCDFLYNQLQVRQRLITDCREGTASEVRCNSLQRFIGTMRTYETDFARPSVTQGWFVEPPVVAVSSEVRQEVARRLDVELADVRMPTSIELTGLPQEINSLARYDEDSWAGRLVGLLDFNEPPVWYSETGGLFVTQDHLVACGLLDGVVQLDWTQTARVSVALDTSVPPVPGTTLWAVYRYLQGVEPSEEPSSVAPSLWRAVHLGAALSSALAQTGMSPPYEGDSQRLSYIVERLYDDDLNLLSDLTEQSLADPPGAVVVDVETAWLGSWAPDGAATTTP
jgi:hypothetical protein